MGSQIMRYDVTSPKYYVGMNLGFNILNHFSKSYKRYSAPLVSKCSVRTSLCVNCFVCIIFLSLNRVSTFFSATNGLFASSQSSFLIFQIHMNISELYKLQYLRIFFPFYLIILIVNKLIIF